MFLNNDCKLKKVVIAQPFFIIITIATIITAAIITTAIIATIIIISSSASFRVISLINYTKINWI